MSYLLLLLTLIKIFIYIYSIFSLIGDKTTESTDSTIWKGLGAKIHHRLLHRFSNAYSAEFVRKVKRNEKLSKKSALRQGLGGATSTGKSKKKKSLPPGMPTVDGLISDPLPKSFSHHCLKAQAYKGPEVFHHFSHSELKFMFEAYGLKYNKNSKDDQCKVFAEKLKTSGDAMPLPEKLTAANLQMIKKSGSSTNRSNQVQRQPNQTSARNPQTAENSNRNASAATQSVVMQQSSAPTRTG